MFSYSVSDNILSSIVVVVVVVCSGLTSLSTMFQSYHDGATESSMLTFIVLPY